MSLLMLCLQLITYDRLPGAGLGLPAVTLLVAIELLQVAPGGDGPAIAGVV